MSANFQQASLVISNFNRFCLLLAFDSQKDCLHGCWLSHYQLKKNVQPTNVSLMMMHPNICLADGVGLLYSGPQQKNGWHS
jgi:hypothetical protein